MEKVYKDPGSGYTLGPFPKAKVKITRELNCPAPRYEADTTLTDSLAVDSTNFEVAPETEMQPTQNEPVMQKADEKNTTELPKQPATEAPLTRKEEREQRRKQRQEEKEKKKNNTE